MRERTGHAGADVVAWDGECNGGKYQSGNATESLLGRDWLDWTGGDEVSCLLLGRVERRG